MFLQYGLCFNRCTKFLCHKSLTKRVITISILLLLSDPKQRILPHYLASLSKHSGLTSLKRFQCLILRLYCEMVDSHCSSSMKFPVFSASLTLFTSAWMVEPASITSGTRRHTISVISTMVADKKNLAHTSCRASSCEEKDAETGLKLPTD